MGDGKGVRKGGFEPPRANAHYPLKVACIPISPLAPKNITGVQI